MSPTSGRSPAISRRAIRTGSWLAPIADIKARRAAFRAVLALCALPFVMLSLSSDTEARRSSHRHGTRPIVHPIWPVELPNSQYAPITWAEIPGWSDDDHLAAFKTFRTSCAAVVAQTKPPA